MQLEQEGMYDDQQDVDRADIKSCDMSEDMQRAAVNLASQALRKEHLQKEIAAFMKKEFDHNFTPNWHCVVGTSFGS